MNDLWIEFVNSDARDYLGHGRHEDRLESGPWLRDLLARWNLPPLGAGNRAAITSLRRLRGLLQRMVRPLVAGRPVRDADLKALNALLERQPVTGRVERADGAFRLRLVPAGRGLDVIRFEIASSFASFLVHADPTRLKLCRNPDCRWVFYDTTRSRTRAWCADVCGNLMKVRRFRARRGGR